MPVQIVPSEHELITKSKSSNISTHAKEQVLLGVLPNSNKIIKYEEDAIHQFDGQKIFFQKVKFIDKIDDIIIINSFDGAEAFRTKNNVSSVLSLSSSLMTSRMIKHEKIKVGESFNICTWMQVMGKESYKLVDKVTWYQYWSNRHKLSIGETSLKHVPRSKVWMYDVHGGKMLYSLLQYSMWNRKHNPLLL